jgi:hypothetical protein
MMANCIWDLQITVIVPKSVYTGTTGLFKTINDNIASDTFASFANPSFTDYNGIGNIAPSIPFDSAADSAIVGTAVESGPAFSTNTSYSNPSTMTYLPYYETILSKGYHLGATINHENHHTNFGRTTTARTAIIAPLRTKTKLVKNMRKRNLFY